MNFTVSANHRGKIKENEKRDKYLYLSRRRRKQWNMRVKLIPTVIGALETSPEAWKGGLEALEIREWIVIFQTTAKMRSARILRKVLETWRDLLSIRLQWRPPANTGVKKIHKDYNNYHNNSIVEICLNTEKSPGDLRRPEQTCCHLDSSEDHQLTLVWKTQNNNNNNNNNVAMIPIVIGALGTIPKGLVKILEDVEIRG